jgi:RHS repeat-associated protein
VSYPAYEVVTDANGNDTEYTLGGTDDYGNTWADYVVTGVANYSGCSPHHPSCSGGTGTRLKSATYGLTAITSGGAPSISPAFVPVPGTLPPSKVTQTTTHLPTTGGDKLSRVTSTLAPAYGTCTVYSYPLYQDGGNPQFPSSSYSQCYLTGQIASTATYDYGTAGSGSVGALLKTDSLTYAWQSSSSVLSANMLDLVSTDVITDGSANWAAETDKCYDGNGNNTSVQKFPTQPSSRSCTSPPSNAIVTSATYSQGVVTSTKDALANQTTMSNFACNGALPQTITLPDQNQIKYQYDCNTGKVTSVQDQNDINNSVSTTYTYDDPLNRVTSASYPDGGSISVNYHSDSLPLTMTITKQTGEAAGPNVATKIYDGLARLTQTQTSDALPGVADTIYTYTNYDALGRNLNASNPTRTQYTGPSSIPTSILTTTYYDAIGRESEVLHPDGTSQLFSYNGNIVTFTDESANQWQKTSDALGRLTQVLEPSSTSQSPTLPTNYSYDSLGNLKSVNQVGLSGADSARNRSFAYDALSRLLAANNPEKASGSSGPTQACTGVSGTWTNCYSYDGDGNVLQETDNRGISIQYAYDTMNRVYSKAYFKGGVSTGEPSACYQYSTPISTANDKYPKEYLTLEWTQAGTCPGPSSPQTSIPTGAITSTAILQHDPMGRIQLEQVCPLGPCATAYQFSYSYDLAGNVTGSNNGLPASTSSTTMPAISWGETYDAANRMSLLSVTSQPWSDSAHPSVLFQANQNTYSTFGSSMPYDPFGHLVNEQLGLTTSSSPSTSAISTQRAYNNMGRILTETDVQSAPQSSSSNSTGQIVISGTEAGPFTTPPTSGSSTMSITGTDGSHVVCQTICNQYTCYQTCNDVYDTGTISVTIDNFTSSASYSSSSTDASLAQSLSQGFAGSSSPLTSSYGGSNAFTVTAKATGTASNYPITMSNGDYTIGDPNQTLTGGTNGGPVYDAGTITATVTNNSVTPPVNYSSTVNWGQGDTPSTIASHLASGINSVSGIPVTATPNGGTINLISKSAGSGTNYAVSVSVADSETSTYPSYFPSPSFSAASTNMAVPIYSYQVPVSGGYTPNGNIAIINDSVNGNWNYSYDHLNRLQTASASSGSYANQYGCWAYDSFGNRTAEAFGSSSCPSLETSVTPTASYNSNNQLSGTAGNSGKFQYDSAGDVTTDPLNSYLYDGEGRLCAVQNSNKSVYQYVYDAEGRRVAKATLTSWPSSCLAPSSAPGFSAQVLYLRGSGGMQTTELTGAGAWVHTNFFGGPAPMVTYASSGWAFAFHFTDYLGSRRALTDAQGNVLETCQNLPYGNAETCGTTPTEHLFTGKERDVESGNDYFEARFYSSISGRFMSPDWSAKVAPVPYATMDDPQSLNLYAYVHNNPITGLDPDGHMSNADFSQMFMMGLAAKSGSWMEQQAEQAAQAQQEEAYENALAAFLTSFFFPSGDGGDPAPATGGQNGAQPAPAQQNTGIPAL